MVYCDVCQAFVQVVHQTAGKALGATVAALFGVGPATLEGKILFGLTSILVGHFIDRTARPACGECGSPLRGAV